MWAERVDSWDVAFGAQQMYARGGKLAGWLFRAAFPIFPR